MNTKTSRGIKNPMCYIILYYISKKATNNFHVYLFTTIYSMSFDYILSIVRYKSFCRSFQFRNCPMELHSINSSDMKKHKSHVWDWSKPRKCCTEQRAVTNDCNRGKELKCTTGTGAHMAQCSYHRARTYLCSLRIW